MIKEPTVLILGAGASAPYGFPTGKELKEKICKGISDERWMKAFVDDKFDLDEVKQYANQLRHSGKTSVDAFLEHRKEFIEIGKLTLALALIPFEIKENLYETKDIKGNWYEHLFNKMNTNFDEFEDNKLATITFNYDRSFEHFLFTSLRNSYGKSEEKVVQSINKIPIIHLHGQLGLLPWQSQYNSRSYSDELLRKAGSGSAKHIKIISESIDDDPEFKEAYKSLVGAKYIYFLGFGYNDVNLKRLGISSYTDATIKGTSFGLGDAERKEIKMKYPNIELADSKYDVLDFLREEVIFR
ncbi:MAG: SIR2 family protein [Ignavibacteriales bacterium]|nr:SIR2 family protein [Ignavibacteriales bacterium]